MIMDCSKSSWYKDKIGKTYKVVREKAYSYLTKDGEVSKKDAEVIEK